MDELNINDDLDNVEPTVTLEELTPEESMDDQEPEELDEIDGTEDNQ